MSGPRRIGAEARTFVGKSAAADAVVAAAVLEAWGEVAGAEILKHTEGARFRKGELLVHVDSSAWANELQLMSEHLRERIDERLGKETVTSIKFTVSRKVGDRNRRKAAEDDKDHFYSARRTVGRDLTEREKEAVSEVARHVPDAGLRDALRRAMEASLRIRGGAGKTRR